MLLSALDQTVVGTALPGSSVVLHGVEHYVWVTTGYLLAAAASMPIWGKLSDAYGRKPSTPWAWACSSSVRRCAARRTA